MTRAEIRAHFAQKLVEWEKEFGGPGSLPKPGQPGFEDGEGSLLDRVVREALKLGITGEQLVGPLKDLADLAQIMAVGRKDENENQG